MLRIGKLFKKPSELRGRRRARGGTPQQVAPPKPAMDGSIKRERIQYSVSRFHLGGGMLALQGGTYPAMRICPWPSHPLLPLPGSGTWSAQRSMGQRCAGLYTSRTPECSCVCLGRCLTGQAS
jgi:hypothetical protein